MTDLLSITAPIFMLIALGFVAVRMRVVAAELVPVLGAFVLNFAMPALILHALMAQDLRQTLNWNYIIAYAGGSLVVYAISMALFRVGLRRGLTHASIAMLGSAASNSGFVGFPVASLAIGSAALTALPLSMLVEVVLIIPLALALAEIGQSEGKSAGGIARDTALRLIRMPVVMAIVLGIVLSALGLRLPAALGTAVDMLASASAACALFVVGGTLASSQTASMGSDIAWISLGKLVLHPLAVWAGFLLLGDIPPDLMAAGIILASAPMLTAYPIFAQRFGFAGLAAAALLVATVAGFVTMTMVLALLQGDQSSSSLTGPRAGRQISYDVATEPSRAGRQIDMNGA